ncbi:MAG: glycosyltransferase family 2 protein [Dehalococcoidia bacterium]|nr:glycosyltransferase family 2 protein [Dehalococcoidia bacterium]
MTGLPLVSIVTPSFNQARFLEETIRSVQSQDYPNAEHLVLDGGSTDGSLDIIHRYAENLAYWVSEADRGQSHAINKGFARAGGEILSWLNSDDLLRPGAITRAVAGLAGHPEAHFIYSDLNVKDELTGKTTCCKSWPIDFAGLLAHGDIIPQPTVFMRRSLLDRVGMLDETLHMSMDYDLWLRATATGPAVYLPGPPLATARVHENAKTFAEHARFAGEILRILDRVYSDPHTPESGLRVKRAAYACAFWFAAYRCAVNGHEYREAAHLFRISLAWRPLSSWRRPLGTMRMLAHIILGAPAVYLKRLGGTKIPR